MKRVRQNIQFAIETLSELRDERDKADEVKLAINIAIGAMKQFDDKLLTPKKPTYEDESISDGRLVYDTWICPCCGKVYELDYDDYKHCPECGQAIDWSEVEIDESKSTRC